MSCYNITPISCASSRKTKGEILREENGKEKKRDSVYEVFSVCPKKKLNDRSLFIFPSLLLRFYFGHLLWTCFLGFNFTTCTRAFISPGPPHPSIHPFIHSTLSIVEVMTISYTSFPQPSKKHKTFSYGLCSGLLARLNRFPFTCT